MGCTASKLDHEDTVRRCKEGRRLIKEAVFSRHHLAAAHADYCRSLRVTGFALSNFAADEPLSVSDSTPAVLPPNNALRLLPRNPSNSPLLLLQSARAALPSCRPLRLLRQSSRLRRTPRQLRAPIFLNPHILSASSLKSSERRKSQPKLPHILSDSSHSSTPTTVKSAGKFDYPTYVAQAAFPTSPSQASSVWNWENFRPPSPPDSDFFSRYRKEDDDATAAAYYPQKSHQDHHLEAKESDEEGRGTERERRSIAANGEIITARRPPNRKTAKSTSTETTRGRLDPKCLSYLPGRISDPRRMSRLSHTSASTRPPR